ncbi:TPA: hypothetical protein ACGAHT_003229 [Salmonella enterica subsp. enterica serovar Newport]|uniref:Uncharacterized protein n=2 Tax=Salmonella enterica I TaxID=59201 RepID=A0A635CPB5_SALTM|nr:hypothetical protein [Salmonella enterica]EAC0266435.1 hypothetical protein [Salmonella enterica subsp. enterica serovar Typhimurium]ECO0811240.1 hypothetical protein [Salmonella enterica subsp. enterica serovar Newport]EDV4605168.1 hypothetical protein [Salmonella enterica subsp. enterica]AUF34855.1 hypothetical protein AW90_50115 [Salmonella enterica subsp. enterica serovar Newport str. CDC 2010K-2159]EBX2373766.1 hypothetical protein [Salmonella enterica subsp. enterica serovar Typhimuri
MTAKIKNHTTSLQNAKHIMHELWIIGIRMPATIAGLFLFVLILTLHDMAGLRNWMVLALLCLILRFGQFIFFHFKTRKGIRNE